MALSVKASSSVILLALRANGSSTATKVVNYAFRPLRQCQSQSMSFSSVATSEDLVNAILSKVLEWEISSAKSTIKDSLMKTPMDPFHFEVKHDICKPYPIISGIEDIDYLRRGTIQLEKKFPDGQLVNVSIDLRKFDTCEDDKERDGSKKDIKSLAIPMIVEVHKPGKYGGQIRFGITVAKGDIVIQWLNVNNYRKGGISNISYLGEPKIREMDNELQRCLSKYVEIRGITNNIASFLLKSECMTEKEKDLKSLKLLKKLIEM